MKRYEMPRNATGGAGEGAARRSLGGDFADAVVASVRHEDGALRVDGYASRVREHGAARRLDGTARLEASREI